jgi:hypothetical protein
MTPIPANVAWKKRRTTSKVRALTRRSKNQGGRIVTYSKQLREPRIRGTPKVGEGPYHDARSVDSRMAIWKPAPTYHLEFPPSSRY